MANNQPWIKEAELFVQTYESRLSDETSYVSPNNWIIWYLTEILVDILNQQKKSPGIEIATQCLCKIVYVNVHHWIQFSAHATSSNGNDEF